jgi:signal peptidase I
VASDPEQRDEPVDGLQRRQNRNEEAMSAPSGSSRHEDPSSSVDTSSVDTSSVDTSVDGVTESEIAAARAARRKRANKSATRNLLEWVGVIVGAVVIAVVVRTFLFQTFWIPSPSMAQTLVEDDRVLVNKLSYRFGDVDRGDVVVFERPPNETGTIKDLIKRVIALPGERVSIRDGRVHIDGRALDEPYADGLPTEPRVGCGAGDTTGIDTAEGMLVPEGQVLVLGDNRVNSSDGRCFGPIDEDLIVGRAFVILWPPSKAGLL